MIMIIILIILILVDNFARELTMRELSSTKLDQH